MTLPLQFFSYQNNKLSAEQVSLQAVVQKTGTPVYVYSSKAFLSPLLELQKGLSGLDHLICFAVKSNSNIAILKLLAQAGAGFDLVSGGELFRVLQAGGEAQNIVFSGVGKTADEMKMALEFQGKGIFSFNVESVEELICLNRIAMDLNRKASIALRFNPDVNPKTHPYISTGLKKNKFGLSKQEVLKVVASWHKFPALKLLGISIHIGSQITSLAPLKDAFSRLVDLVNQLNGTLPHPLEFVDLGGGVGITYKKEKTPSLSAYCALIHQHFGKKSRLKTPIKVLIEPGRTLSGNSGVLITKVLYRKQRPQRDFLIVDAGMNDLARPSLYGSHHEIALLNKKTRRGRRKKTSVVGPVCETADCFASDRILSTGIQRDELLAILSAGAYGFSMTSNYNSRPRPPEVLVHQGTFHIIRERETYEDLIRHENSSLNF